MFNLWLFAVSLSAWFLASRGQTTPAPTYCDLDNCASYTGNASDVENFNSATQLGTGCVHCDSYSCDIWIAGACDCPTKSYCDLVDDVGTIVAAAGAAALCCCICIILAVTLPTIAIIVGIVICCMQQNKTKTVVVTQTAPAGQTQT
mmetsp:Transcript_4769/g.8163  ORF Transcript_4769/g.8163 Transcript_4769/m.8163 type:complete len:147 (-) Transcript_4769:409-849(-)